MITENRSPFRWGFKELLHSYGLWILLVIFIVTRLFLFIGAKPWEEERKYTHFVFSDAGYYYQTAINLLEGHGHSSSPQEPYTPSAKRTPGYPIFLSIIMLVFGKSVTWIVACQMMLQLITLILVYLGTHKLFSSITAFWLTLYCTLDPVYLSMSAYLYSETLYQFVNVILVYLLIRGISTGFGLSRIMAIAVLFGLGLLTRPIGLYFLPLILLTIAFREKKITPILLKGALIVACILLVLSPWLIRNHFVFGRWSLSSITGTHLYYFFGASFLAMKEGIPAEKVRARLRSQTPHFTNPFERSDYLTNEAFRVIKESPLQYTLYHFTSVWPVFVNANTRALSHLMDWTEIGSPFDDTTKRDIRAKSILAANLIMQAILYTFFIIGIWRLWEQRQFPMILLILGGIFYFLGVIGPEASSRYRLSFVPFLLFGAGVGMQSVEWLRNRELGEGKYARIIYQIIH